MEEKKLLFEKRPHPNRVPKCYRSGTIVEPMLSPQWFISVEKEFTDRFTSKKTTLKKLMQEAVREKHVNIVPKKFEKVYFQWIDNLRRLSWDRLRATLELFHTRGLMDSLQVLGDMGMDALLVMLAGGLVLAVPTGLCTYVLVRRLFTRLRNRRRQAHLLNARES